MLWVVYGLLHGMFRAAFVETGRVYRADAWQTAFWHAVFGALILLPVLPFAYWPADGRFYFAAAVVAAIMAVGTLIQLKLAARKKGRISSIYMPLEAWGALLLWVAVTPAAFYRYAGNPVMTLFVLAAFAVAAAAIVKIRPQDIGVETLSAVAPVGVSYAVAGIVTKLVVPEAYAVPAALAYVFIGFAVTAAVTGLALFLFREAAEGRKKPGGKALRAGIVAGAFAAMAQTTFVGSVALAPNPGYTSLLAMLLPVWLAALHRVARVQDGTGGGAAFMLVLAVVILVVAVAAG